MPEQLIWKGSPSHWTNFWIYLTAIFIVPIPYVLWRWIELRCRVYEITDQRIRYSSGVFTKSREDLELYRVKDYRLIQPFWFRILGLGHVELISSDRTHPVFVLRAVPNPEAVLDTLRDLVEKRRDEKRVRELDMTEQLEDTDQA
jgi:uncharacterized membrane protein YdbT with pleckstrin-like domain